MLTRIASQRNGLRRRWRLPQDIFLIPLVRYRGQGQLDGQSAGRGAAPDLSAFHPLFPIRAQMIRPKMNWSTSPPFCRDTQTRLIGSAVDRGK
jgi:hypothetical protein